MKKGLCQGHEWVSGSSELLVKGEGRKEAKLYLNTVILSNLHPYIKIGTLFYLKDVEVGVVQKRKSLQRLVSQEWAKTCSCSQCWHVFTSLPQTLSFSHEST